MFGTLSEEDGKYYESQINQLKYNQATSQKEIQKMKLVIKSSLQFQESATQQINENIKRLDNLRSNIDYCPHPHTFSMIMHHSNLIMEAIGWQVNELSSLMNSATLDQLRTSLINETLLAEVLQEFRLKTENDIVLPYETCCKDILDASKVSLRLMQENLIFEIKIPLVLNGTWSATGVKFMPFEKNQLFCGQVKI